MNDPFLVGKCLTPAFVAFAHGRGHHAAHVNFRGLSGAPDREVMRAVQEDGFVLVTSSARDFLRLHAAEGVHAGLVVIVPGRITAEAQVRLFGRVLDVVEPMAKLTNALMEVFSDGSVRLRAWPEAAGGT